MIDLKTVSVSSINRFVECPRKWAMHYDKPLRITSNSTKTDKGTLVHGALELWDRPGSDLSFADLENSYHNACVTIGLSENFETYCEGRKLLPATYELLTGGTNRPLERTVTWSREHRIPFWKPSHEFPLAWVGFIDRVQLVTNHDGTYTIIIEDYKTGRAKTREELKNDPQPGMYLAYARHGLVRFFEERGYVIHKVTPIWTYLATSDEVILSEDDYDIPATMAYISNISHQMVAFVQVYNSLSEEERQAYINEKARTNSFCSWCDYKNSCPKVERAITERKELNIFADGVTLEEILAMREMYVFAKYEGERRQREIDEMLRAYFAQNGKYSLEVGGKKYQEIAPTSKTYPLKVVAEALGIQFIIQNAKVSGEAIKHGLGTLKVKDPAAHERAVQLLEQNAITDKKTAYIKATDISAPAKVSTRTKSFLPG